MRPHDFWQEVFPAGHFPTDGPFSRRFPATLPDGRQIVLPIRVLPGGRHAIASLIINQASFAVQDALAQALAEELAPFRPEIVVGLPTLGLTLAAAVARRLGHVRYVPLGTSRKFWYDEALAVSLTSVTSPEQSKRLFMDPRMLDLLAGARIAVVDDVISSGRSMVAAVELLKIAGMEPSCLGCAMLQTRRWEEHLQPKFQERMRHVFATPLLVSQGGGDWALDDAITILPEPGNPV
jgi:adenine/guanine phosphoribosyltransferase-like PRPP-binding protein